LKHVSTLYRSVERDCTLDILLHLKAVTPPSCTNSGTIMSHDELPPSADPTAARSEPARWLDEEPRQMSGRGRLLSWIGGLVGLALLIGLALYLSRSSSDQSGQSGAAGGRHRGGGGGRGGFGGGRGGMNQPTTVGTAKAALADLPITAEALGSVTPAATVTVRPQVSGTITQILFREGQMVRKGEALAIIDPRPYRAQLLQAQGALIRDKAQLENARVQLKRYDILIQQDSIARQDRDTQAALVHQLEGTIAVDQGQVQAAEINLGYTRIISPVAGRVGIRVVDVGNYIAAGDTNGVAVVTTLQPIDVEFAIPQQQGPAINKREAQGAEIPALALDSTRTQTLDTGRFSTLDNRVDPTTGTIKGKARFANSGNQLYPSQFVNVRLTIDTVKNALTVPPSAVRTGPDGNFVWLLKSDRTVTERKVKIGVTTADKIQITDGLALGDIAITDGGDRLTEGAKVALPGDRPAAGGGKSGAGGHHRRRGGTGG
jgi:multidrug efflux system membrane fusion protein